MSVDLPEATTEAVETETLPVNNKVTGLRSGKLRKWAKLLSEIDRYADECRNQSDRELRKRSLALRYRSKSGEKPSSFLAEAYGLVREAGRRTKQMRHFDVQMLGGIALFNGSIAEMQTGEGKTLTATLPMYIHALAGKGAHLATVNDYLAKRDAEIMRPIYELLGLSVGIIQTDDTPDQRRVAYGCDITYGTAKEFGFDFLRDRLLLRRLGREMADFLGEGSSQRWDDQGDKPVQRTAYFCLVDEADSILIDEARTPLIIGSIGEEAREQLITTYMWAAEFAEHYVEDEHYEYDQDKHKVELTIEGRQLLRSFPQPEIMRGVGLVDLYQFTERAVKVRRDFHLDQQYVVIDGEIVIVDEFTGRLAEGRKWRDGIHQAIEAKEEVEVTVPTGQAARITVQDLFLRYKHLAGMTGTAMSAAREFKKIYKTRVYEIPTNRPCLRERLPDRVFGTADEKWQAVADEVEKLNQLGRPVLIGTRSIDKSQVLSELLNDRGIVHQILNAHEVAKEADIVALAGEEGKVTVATNMAGRGTDIKLQSMVAGIGGLQVICTELHDAARIDRQLIGRCARQGDPGTYRQYMSLDDEIIHTAYGFKKYEKVKSQGESLSGSVPGYAKIMRKAQRKVQRRHFRDRSILLHHEKERKKIQREMGQDPYLDTPD